MAVIAFPRVTPRSITPQLQTDVTHLRGPFSPIPVQSFSSGISYWSGTITWDTDLWAHDIDDEHNLDDITAFLDACEGGLHEFDIPMHYLNKGRALRFPGKDETTAANSVMVTATAPSTQTTTHTGSSSVLTLDTVAAAGVGLRRGDWISLRDTEDTPPLEADHRGAYRVSHTQVDGTVVVAPNPAVGAPHRLISRLPVLRARLSAPPPAIAYDGAWTQPITIAWEAAT